MANSLSSLLQRRPDLKTRLAKWGTGLGLRIPRSVLVRANVKEGDEVDVTLEHGAILIRPSITRYTLDELVDAITPRNMHRDVDWGPRVGKEVW